MYKRKTYLAMTRFACITVLLAACCVRLLSQPLLLGQAVDYALAFLKNGTVVQWLVAAQTGVAPGQIELRARQLVQGTPDQTHSSASEQDTQQQPEQDESVQDTPAQQTPSEDAADLQSPDAADDTQISAQPQDETAPAQITYTQADADGISIGGSSSYTVDKLQLLTAQLPFTLPTADAPAVLIVHTHASESYAMEQEGQYTPSGTARTLDTEYNMVRVGEEIAAVLQERGISVIHDTSINDYPSYNDSYSRTAEVISGYLAQYPAICMVLDVHRDAALDESGQWISPTTTIDGQTAAQIMLVMGTDEGGLSHPDWQQNLSVALKVQANLNRSAPGLCKNLALRTERFNQHFTPGSMLVEIGASGNTLSQALVSARLFAQGLADTLLYSP